VTCNLHLHLQRENAQVLSRVSVADERFAERPRKTKSRSINMQSSAVHQSSTARKRAYFAEYVLFAPTLRSNATTSSLFRIMAKSRGVLKYMELQ
jgi:hypothetical protein